MLMWAAHAAIDWDWQMPVITIVFFALGGMTLGRDAGAPQEAWAGAGLAPVKRAALGIGCGLLGVAPVYVWLSQRDLDSATSAFSAHDCATATRAGRVIDRDPGHAAGGL